MLNRAPNNIFKDPVINEALFKTWGAFPLESKYGLYIKHCSNTQSLDPCPYNLSKLSKKNKKYSGCSKENKYSVVPNPFSNPSPSIFVESVVENTKLSF